MFPSDEMRKQYASAIARSTGIKFHDALARVLRIEKDPELFESLMKVNLSTNGTTFVTDVTRGPGGVEVSVMPAGAPELYGRLRQVGSTQLAYRNLERARSKMRASVAYFEVCAAFGKPHTALPLLPSVGICIQ